MSPSCCAPTSAPDDFVARVGGDEFVVVCTLPTATAELGDARRAHHRADAPAGALSRATSAASAQHRHRHRAGAERRSAKRLLINADIALYRAKGRGKNRYEFFSEALQAEIVNTKRVADDILRGIEQDEFLPYYQPLFDAQTLDARRRRGAGALAAIRPSGMLAPAASSRSPRTQCRRRPSTA